MKREVWLIGLLFVLILVITQMIYSEPKSSEVSEPAVEVWQPSPAFEVNYRKMIGEPFKFGIFEDALKAEEQTGIHWYLWGDQQVLVSSSFKLTGAAFEAHDPEPLILADNVAIAYGSNGADAQVPTLLTIPYPGMWKFDAYLDDQWFGSIIVDVP